MGTEAGLLDIVRRVVQQELMRTGSSQLGVVSAVHAHTEADDGNNHEVDLKLKHADLELTRVPIAVPHIGTAAPPRVGDLVLVQFLDGDLNQPFVAGRFYHADDAPPVHQEDDVLFEHRVPDGTRNQLRFAADGSIFLQRDVTQDDNSEAKTSLKIAGDTGDVELKLGDKIVLTLKHDAKIEITADGKPIAVKCDKLTVTGNVDITGDLVVGQGPKTTIKNNTIKGG
jgi:phage baseplate assembly protein gpV